MAALCGTALLLQLRPQATLDMWWHLEQGRAVWRHGARTYPDPSGMGVDALYTNPEWLFDLALFGVHGLLGVPGVVAVAGVAAVVAAALTFLLARTIAEDTHRASLVAGLAVLATAWRFAPRPQSAMLVLLPWVLWLAWRGGRARRRGRWGAALILSCLVWSQSHSSMIIAPAVVALAGLGSAEARRDRTWLAAIACCAAVPLLGPFGLDIVGQVLGHAGTDAARHIADMRPMPLEGWWPQPGNSVLFLELLLLVGVGAAVVRRRTSPLLFGLVLLGLAMTLTAHRFRAAWALLAIPWVAATLRHPTRPGTALRMAAAVVLWGGLAWAALGATRAEHWGWDPADAPVDGAVAVRAAGLDGDLFNAYDDGGYLGWALSPHNRVFIDGRTPVHFGSEHFYAARRATADSAVLDGLHARFGFAGALLRRRAGACEGLATSPDWRVVWLDQDRVLFTPTDRLPPHIQPLHALAPCAPSSQLDRCRETGDSAAMLAEVRRLTRLTPDAAWPWRLAAVLAMDCAGAPPEDAAPWIARAQELEPDHADTRWLAARLLLARAAPAEAAVLLEDVQTPRAQDTRLGALAEAGDTTAALALGQQLIETRDDGASAELRCTVATLALAEGHTRVAAIEATRAGLADSGRCAQVRRTLDAQGFRTAEQRYLVPPEPSVAPSP